MIRGTKNFLKKMEMRVAIGIKFEATKEGDRFARPICGNVQSVNEHAKYFVTVSPGELSQNALAAEIRRQLLIKSMPEDKPLIEAIPAEDIQRLLPAGSGSILG
jgi:hypothetical protein